MAKQYYWLKLKTNFFDTKEMRKLRKIAGGDTYTIIYLKLLLLSIKSDGKIEFEGIEKTFAEELSLIMDEEAENIKITIAFLASIGLIEESSPNLFFFPEAIEMTGSECESAPRARKCRANKAIYALQCNALVTECNTEKEKEIEIDLETEKEIETGAIAPVIEPKKKKASLVIPLIYSLSPELTDALYQYVEHRKAIKAPMTQNAFELSIKELFKIAKTDGEMIEIINQSIMNGWKGLFPLKDHGGSKNAPSKPMPTPDEYRSKTTW